MFRTDIQYEENHLSVLINSFLRAQTVGQEYSHQYNFYRSYIIRVEMNSEILFHKVSVFIFYFFCKKNLELRTPLQL